MRTASVVLLLPALVLAPAAAQQIQLSTPDQELRAAFDWAQGQALKYVSTGGDPVGPWYEAALPNRQAFCMRDVSHQSMGAHALRLDTQNRNMLGKFAANISESKDWCSYWEINRQDLPAPVDYRNDAEFWYNLPANFDVLDACFRMCLWSGDRAFVDGAAFLNFYRRTVNEYVSGWDLQPDRIMKRQRIMNVRVSGDSPSRLARNRGIPSYDEGRRDFVVAADLIAAQVAAYTAYSRIAMLRGERDEADRLLQLAAGARTLLNTTWWDEARGQFYSHLDLQHRLLAGATAASVLYFGAAAEDRIPRAIEGVLRRVREGPMIVEEQSHLPEILYRYGRNEAAYEQLLDLARTGKPRREYPEVSYAVIGAIVTGLMGVEVDPTRVQPGVAWNKSMARVVMTFPRLTSGTEWAELQHMPVRANDISVRHEGTGKTTLANLSGPALTWQACFPGPSDQLWIDGRRVPARVVGSYGTEGSMSCATTKVAPGGSVTVQQRKAQ